MLWNAESGAWKLMTQNAQLDDFHLEEKQGAILW